MPTLPHTVRCHTAPRANEAYKRLYLADRSECGGVMCRYNDERILPLLKKRNQVDRIYHNTSFRPAAMAGGEKKSKARFIERAEY